MALPANWASSDPPQILATLLDALIQMLPIGFVFARLNDPDGGPPLEMARVPAALEGIVRPRELAEALGSASGSLPEERDSVVLVADAAYRISSSPLGLRGEIGVLVAGSQRLDFPVQTETLLLEVGASQAAIALQQARFSHSQKRLADELDERVTRRTSELAAANEALKMEVAELRREEAALRDSERESRLIVDNIPGLIALLGPRGDVEVANRRLFEYLGQSLEQIQHWATTDTVHPDDLPHVVEVFSRSIASGLPYDIVQRFRRADGVYRWFHNSGFPIRDRNGEIARWCVLLTDIDERKRAEDAIRTNERNLQLTIDSIPALAWVARPDGTPEFFNQHYLDFVGVSPEQARGWDWTTAVNPADWQRLASTWGQIMSSGEAGSTEARLRRFDGEFRWFLFRANPLRDESGAIVKWYGINTDIEDRKRAEAVLSARERELREMTETIPEMLWSATPDGAIDYCNTRFLEYTGFTAQAVTHDGWQKTLHPEDLARILPVWMSCVATGALYRVEVRTFHVLDGTYRWCTVTALPQRDEHGRISKWHGTIVDMHDWKQAQEELRSTQSALEHVTRVITMGELTASIAHEVNQPLSGIVTNAGTCLKMLAADPPNIDGARETARRTIRDGKRASEVIERLRALFGKKEATTDSVDLNDAIREVIALASVELRKNRVVLRSDMADSLPLVTGDRIQLQQVVLNLMMNASDAMRSIEDRQRLLSIRTELVDDDAVRVTVQDAGGGFEPRSKELLFGAFYSTKSTGMGMGLSVSRSIIARHQGRLWAELNDGPGATFSFVVPCNPVQATSRPGE